jgi:hypothetical protein
MALRETQSTNGLGAGRHFSAVSLETPVSTRNRLY